MKYNLYVERPGHVMPPKRLTDAEYAAAIARFPRVCADVIPINRKNKTIYLMRRKLGHPSGWWWIGGGLNAGELPEKAAMRNLKRETSLELPVERFQPLPHLNFYLWSERDYEPKNLGCNDIVFCYLIEPSLEEIAKASQNLDKTEYEQNAALKEFTKKDIETETGFNELARKVILELYDEIFPIEQNKLWRVVLISFKPYTPETIKQEVYNRYQTLDKDCGGREAGILLWKVVWNLDHRKNIHLVEIAIYENNAALQTFRVHPKHKEFTNILREVADWQVGDIPLPLNPT